jgi:hypothetical protein
MIATLLAYAAAYVAEAAAISYTTAYFAVTFAVSAIVSRIFSVDPTANASVDNGVRQQVPPAMSNSIPVVYGDAYLGGTFVDAVLSVDQKVMYYVMAISNISLNGQFTYDRTKFYYGDRLVTFDGTDTTKVVSLTDGAGNVDTKVSGNLYINLYTSTAAGVITNVTGTSPSTFMGGADIASAQRWTGTRQMNGLAFAIIKLTYSQEAGTTQMQPLTFHVGHYLNGTGVAKPGDVWLDYISSETYGGGMVASLIDSASGTALNDYSDATIIYTPSGGGSATQARYRINGVLDTGQNVLSNIDRIMAACDSWNQYNAATGKWTIVINKDTSTTFAFDDTNIIGEIKTSLTDISSSINQVEASFPNSLNRDQRDLVYLETPSGLLYPNEPINKYSCNLDLVNDSVQATYLANRMLEQAREDLLVTISAAYPAIQVDAGDVVSITNAAYGWSAKLFRAMKVSETSLNDGTLGASLDLIEYNAAVYDDASITKFAPTPNSNLASVQYFSSLSAPTVSASRPSAVVPSFDIQLTTPSIGRVTGINLFYSTYPTPTTSQWIFLDKFIAPTSAGIANSTNFSFLNETLPTGTYYFGVVVFNEIGQSAISGASSSLVWNPTGTPGNSSAQAYALYTGNPTVTGSAIVKSGTTLPATIDFSPTSVTAFTSTVQTPASGQSLFQSDGIYNPVTNQTTWQTPYLSNFNVSSLSLISPNLGTVNTGTVAGTSNIDITGNARFRGTGGTGWSGLGTVGLIVNDTNVAEFGIIAAANTTSKSAVYGSNSNSLGYAAQFLNAIAAGTGVTLGTSGYDIGLTAGQIKFSSTPVSSTNPNTLDAYEESTWTPTFTNFGTVSSFTAQYTKIGRTVTFTLIVNISAAGSNASITRFTLPYAANAFTAFSIYVNNITAQALGGWYQALADSGTSVQLSYVPNGSSGNFCAGNFVNGTQIVISGSYNATS